MNKGRIMAWTMFIIGIVVGTMVAMTTGMGLKAPLAGLLGIIAFENYINIIGDVIDEKLDTIIDKILVK